MFVGRVEVVYVFGKVRGFTGVCKTVRDRAIQAQEFLAQAPF